MGKKCNGLYTLRGPFRMPLDALSNGAAGEPKGWRAFGPVRK
jgi:hypothetical protein